jgi:branched-chain amino acid transport system permease protein
MVIGSALAAVAGVLRTFYIQGVVADDFIPLITFTVLSMVILGGVANNLGVLIGTLVMTTVDHFLSPSFLSIIGFRVEFDITYVKYVITGLIMILVLMFRPEGAIPEKPVKTPLLELAKSKEWEVEEELRLNSGD